MDVILVLNAGSSSLKFQVFAADDVAMPISKGRITGIGTQPVFSIVGAANQNLPTDFDQAKSLQHIFNWLTEHPEWHLAAVGHRIVHGGATFYAHQILTTDVMATLKQLIPLAPLHQPHHLYAIEYLQSLQPDLLQVGCFDTIFHANQSRLHQAFALPRSYFDDGVRRYGFHGLSYAWIARQLKKHHPDLYAGRVIAAHLGNGASLCAMKNGESIATTMGMTAIDGVPMGTRSGAIDPGAVLYLIREQRMSAESVEHLLSYDAGLLGLSGISNDMRTLYNTALNNADAQFAIDYFVERIAEYTAKLAVSLGGMDTLVFTGGIGENDTALRKAVQEKLTFMSDFKTLVIPANEEALIVETTQQFLIKQG